MNPLISREEVLGGGLSGRATKQATTLLSLIENRTAHLMAESRQAAARYVPPKTVEARSRAFLEALAQERESSLQPTIRDLERYARQWAELVPDNPTVRATVAHLLGQKYAFTRPVTPGLRAALGLDTNPVQQAYQQQYDQPLETIFAARLSPVEQLRWRWVRLAGWLENLSPFWTAFALTVTETVGASILALPIALAGVGPLAGIGLIIGLGLMNLLTMAGIVEAISRNGNMRYGSSYFGKLVGDYLGPAGSIILTTALLALIFLVLVAFYTGVATTLAEATGIPAPLWAGLLFLVGLYFLRRRSLDATIASALVVGAINLTIVLCLSLLTLPHIRLENLQYFDAPFVNRRPFDTAILQLIFGVILASFFGHTSPANVAKVVLGRDPSGRTLLWGTGVATLVAILFYSLWVVAINGAIAPHVLLETSGTVLTPLATIVGPFVHLVGSIYVVLGMGMTSVYFSLALFNQTLEWLPQPATNQNSRGWLLRPGNRFILGVLPVALTVLLIEWLLLTGRESFTGTLAFLGVITVPVLGGLFPMLMLYASRRKGDYVPDIIWRFLGHPIVVVGVYLIFLVSILLHGLIIWEDLLQRAVALLVGLVMVGATVLFIRRGAFSPRQVVELRLDESAGGRAWFGITTVGRALPAQVELHYKSGAQTIQAAKGEIPKFSTLNAITFHLPASAAKELKVWAHRITPEGDSVGLPVLATIKNGPKAKEFSLPADGQMILLLSGGESVVEVRFMDHR